MTVLYRILPDRSLMPAQLPIGDVAFLDTLGMNYFVQEEAPVAKAEADRPLSSLARMFAYFGSDRA